MALVIAAYFFLVFRRQLKVKTLNVSAIVRQASEKIGPMNRKEYVTAAVLVAGDRALDHRRATSSAWAAR